MGPIERARQLSAALFSGAADVDSTGDIGPALARLHASGLPSDVFGLRHDKDHLLRPGGASAFSRVLRSVGAGDLSVGRLFEGHANAASLVDRHGTAEQFAALGAAVDDGALSAVWNAEGRVPLGAERTAAGWALAGEKILASGAGLITHPIVTARTSDGLVMLMPTMAADERTDLSGWRPQGMRASATGTVRFDGIIVPYSAQIGAPDTYQRQPAFSGGAWRFCAVHLGAAERLLDLYRTHLVERGRDADPYQKQRVAHSVAAVTSAALWVDRAAEMVGCERDTSEAIVAFVNLTRMVTERACLDVLEAVHRGIGLGAFIQPHPVERISRDLSTYLRQPVPDAAMADAAAFALGSTRPSAELWDL